MPFPPAFIDEVIARNPIEDVVGQYVTLKRSGSNLFGLCPFHGEKTPSFSVAPDKGIFYCFGCHTTGDVIDFTAKLFDLSLYDATKKLANDFNIQPLPPGQSAPIPKLPAAMIERKEEQRVLKILIEYERLLEKWKEEFAPSEPEDENWDDRFVHAVHHLPPLSDAIDHLFSSDPDERKEIMDHIRSIDAVAKIEAILNEGCQEVMNDGPEKDRAA